MTAVKPASPTPRQRLLSVRFLIALIAIAIAGSSALIGTSAQLAVQDSSTPADSTPTAEELQTTRNQAIADGVEQLELEFTELNDSGVSGTVTLYDLGSQTLVAINIEGGGESHPAFISSGTCGDLQPEPFARLTVVDDTGESLTLVSTPLAGLLDDDFAIDLRLSPNELGVLIVCANIEGEPTPATPVVEQAGTPSATAEATSTEEAVETPTQAPTEAPTPTAVPTDASATPVGTSEDGTGGPQAAPDTVASLPLMDYSGLRVTGTVSLVAIDDATTKVTIRLTGNAVIGGHIAHLHPGTCAAPQDEGTIYLETVDQNGVSDTTANRSIDELLNGGWIVNVHNSEADYDTWLVCGSLADATVGMTGVGAVTPVADTPAPPPTDLGVASDGTTGIGATGDRATSTLTQGVGVGSGLEWPTSSTESVVWSMATFALVLAAAGFVIRRNNRHYRQPTRWNRLGI